MGIIKSTHAPPSLSPFSMRDVENHAKQILMRAQQQAEALLSAAQAEASVLGAQAQAEGLAAGQAAGLAQGLEQGLREGREQGTAAALEEHRAALETAVAVLSAALVDMDATRREFELQALRDVVELAAAIGRRVTKRQALVEPAVMVANLDEAMKLVVQASDLRIAINPQQRATLDEALPKLRLEWPSLAHAAIVEDESLAPGGVRVYTRQGRVEADIDGQLDRVINELLPSPTPQPAGGQ